VFYSFQGLFQLNSGVFVQRFSQYTSSQSSFTESAWVHITN